jgi:cell division protein ZipA
MNELRWILLVAGALLIVGIYIWGVRARGRGAPGLEPSRRPATFGHDEAGRRSDEASGRDGTEDVEGETIPAASVRRLEPSITLDEDIESVPAIERREPTFAARADSAAPLRVETTGGRAEPTLAPRAEVALEARRPEPVVPAHAAVNSPTPRAAEPAVVAEPARPKRPPQKIFAVRVSANGATRMPGERVLAALQEEGLRFGRYQIFHRLHDDGRPVFSVASLKDPGTFDPQAMPGIEYPGVLVFTVLPGPVGAGEAFDEMLFTARALATHLGGALADDKGVPLTALHAKRLREEALEFERAVAGAA